MVYSSLGRGPVVILHNVKGLNIPEKRTTLLRERKKRRPHFAFLQETYFKTNQIPKLTNTFFTEAFHATNDSAKTKGVSILISKEAPFSLTDRLTAPGGRYILLKGKYGDSPITLANVYFPNLAHVTFCQHMIRIFQGFTSGCLIMGETSIFP